MLAVRRSFKKHGWLSRSVAQAPQISTLVVAEFRNQSLSGATLNTVGAARELGGEVTVLVAGLDVGKVSDRMKSVEGVGQILVADDSCLAHQLAERLSPLLVAVQQSRNFTHVLAPATGFGKNFLPRAAALLDVQPVSDVVQILDANTYVRPIYAGNALQTVKCPSEGVTMLTVRPTAFPAAAESSSSPAPVEQVTADELAAAQNADARVEFLSEDLQQSERPELGSAKVIVSGEARRTSLSTRSMSLPVQQQQQQQPGKRAPAWRKPVLNSGAHPVHAPL